MAAGEGRRRTMVMPCTCHVFAALSLVSLALALVSCVGVAVCVSRWAVLSEGYERTTVVVRNKAVLLCADAADDINASVTELLNEQGYAAWRVLRNRSCTPGTVDSSLPAHNATSLGNLFDDSVALYWPFQSSEPLLDAVRTLESVPLNVSECVYAYYPTLQEPVLWIFTTLTAVSLGSTLFGHDIYFTECDDLSHLGRLVYLNTESFERYVRLYLGLWLGLLMLMLLLFLVFAFSVSVTISGSALCCVAKEANDHMDENKTFHTTLLHGDQ